MGEESAVLAGAAATGNPWLAIAGSAAEGLGQAVGSSAPSTAAGRADSVFDSSGWNVNFGGGSIEATRSQTDKLSEYMPYLLLGAGLLVVWRLTRKR
jgi:hypothetical protein